MGDRVGETVIHSTAVVDAGAEVGSGVEIGPYCVIGAGVELGDGCRLANHVTISGPSKIGKDNRFFPYGSIGAQTQDLKYGGEPTYLKIGDGNTFRECVTVNRSTSAEFTTVIGNHGNFLAYCHVAHECEVGDHVIFSNNGTLAGHVVVGDHAILGGLSAVHQFCRVGRYAITGGCSKIVQDIPPFFIADGNPAEIRGVNQVGLQRGGFSEEVIRQLKQAYRIVYRKGLNVAQAVEALAEPAEGWAEVRELREFIEASERGIIR